jgi:hypothetical protein
LFAALEITSGFVIGKCYKRHRTTEFLDFLKQIGDRVPPDLDIHTIMDNDATHKTALVRAWLVRRPHYHVHFHANISLMDQPGRALVRRAYPQAIAPRCSYLNRPTRAGYQIVHRTAQPEPKALPLNQIHR